MPATTGQQRDAQLSATRADIGSRAWHIYLLLAQTRTAAELADITGLSESTVRRHVATLYAHRLITRRAGAGATAAYRRSAAPSAEVLALAKAAAAPYLRGDRPSPRRRPVQPSQRTAEDAPRRPAPARPADHAPSSVQPVGATQASRDVNPTPAGPTHHRPRAVLAALAVLAVLGGVFVWSQTDAGDDARPPGEGVAAGSTSRAASTPTEAPSATPSEDSAPAARGNADSRPDITLTVVPRRASAFTTIPIKGKYVRGGEGVPLRLQHRDGGRWQTFPLPAVTDAAGRFRAYVELGQTGDHQLRVMDPRAQTTSPVVSITIS